jgi:hypothetical protein
MCGAEHKETTWEIKAETYLISFFTNPSFYHSHSMFRLDREQSNHGP